MPRGRILKSHPNEDAALTRKVEEAIETLRQQKKDGFVKRPKKIKGK